MQISPKTKTALLFGVPVLIGAYLIYRQIKKVNQVPVISTIKSPSTPNIPTKPSANDALPLKVGSRDAGYVQQGKNKYIKLTEDGVFGPKTEEALNFWIQKDTIDNQADYNYLYNMIHPTMTTIDSTDMSNIYQNNVLNY